MDLRLRDEQAETRDAARALAIRLLAPNAARFEREQGVPTEIFGELAAQGLMGVNVPAALGGAERGAVAYCLAMMEIAQGCAATAVTMSVTNMVGEVIVHFGSEEQRQRFNPILCAGGHGAFALSEEGAGSDPAAMRTVARREGEIWILNGTKQWISHGDSSAVLVVWARTGGAGSKGLSCFLVEGGAPGLSIAKHEEKMGLRASHTCALALEEVRVPASALIGGEGGGFRVAMMALDGGRIGIASQAIGIGEAAYAAAAGVLRSSPAPQTEQGRLFALADARTALDAARLLTLRAAQLKQERAPFSREASMAKVFASEAAWGVAQSALELAADEPAARQIVERALRDCRVTRIYEGTSEVQRLVIGRHVLRA